MDAPGNAGGRREPFAVTVRRIGVVLLLVGAGYLLVNQWFKPAQDAQVVAGDFGLQDHRNPQYSTDPADPYPLPPELVGVDLSKQTPEQVLSKSVGCLECHKNSFDPHCKDTVKLGCTDCHGGDATCTDINKAHVQAKYPEFWRSAANPVRSFALLNHESPEFIRFVNPGDLRIAHISCGLGGCHAPEVQTNRKGMMTHGAMLWGAALYDNGSVPYKRARHGEAYSMNGAPLRLKSNPPPTPEEEKKGVAAFFDPLPRYEMSQPGNILRIFERGGRFAAQEIGNPERDEESGRPRARLSVRGLGTNNRTDPVFVSLNKTRLFDPTLNFLGTNDHPGDYRSSGCSACHVVYANDRSTIHSGPYAKFGNKGKTVNPDPTMNKEERGHPIEHKFTNSIPTSQCIICHIHPGTTVMQSYIGYLWHDEETHAELLYPKKQKVIKSEEWVREIIKNPNEIYMKTLMTDDEFLDELAPNLNPKMTKAQFGDYHGHGWAYRAIFKKDLEGHYIDYFGNKVGKIEPGKQLPAAIDFPNKAKAFHRELDKDLDVAQAKQAENQFNQCRSGTPVHLMDIHMEKGMHCVDCHFVQDMHGNNRLQIEVRAAVEIQCIDCHGTSAEYTTLRTTGPASYTSDKDGKGRNLSAMRTPFGKPRFEIQELADGTKRFFQNSCVEPGLKWEVVQTKDTITKGHPRYNEKSHAAKTVRWEEGSDKPVWGDLPTNPDGSVNKKGCAHDDSKMSCISCHSSWNPSCYGCHLPQKANVKMAHNHWEGDVSRNYSSYNFQTLRDEVFMLARDGDATGNRINPSRSSCAIHVGSYNGNRESIYVQQQTISGEGLSGIAFSTNVPHTVRGSGVRETKQCTDCHASKDKDNNALMAQLLMHGTNYLNFVGRFSWVAAGDEGLQAVICTEREEPQVNFGSTLHEVAYPKNYEEFVHKGRKLEAWEHPGRDIGDGIKKPFKKTEVLSVQNRGEYAYCACGEDGVRIFDIAFIDDKAFAERITTAPVSPLGQQFYVKTKNARYVAAPVTTAPDPTRVHFPENRETGTPISLVFAFIYVADAEEGLILINAATLLDGNPINNYLRKDVVFNPDNKLKGARFVEVVGNYAYICCDAGLAVVDLSKLGEGKLEITKIVGEEEHIAKPKCVRVQHRYAYVVDEQGVKVLDVTDLAKPETKSMLRIPHCHSIYLARTYGYLAAGPRGMVVLDIKNPEEPKIDQVFDAGGCMNDTRDIKLGIIYNSQFAYIADGKNGFRLVQTSSTDTPGYEGFSVRPTPTLIGTYKIPFGGKALNVAEGVDRDRAVDESGNQLSVFGRVGARPFTLPEQQKLYLHDKKPWYVSNDPKWEGFEYRTKK